MNSSFRIAVAFILLMSCFHLAPYCSAGETAAPVVKAAAKPSLPSNMKITRTPNAFASVSPSNKRYAVDCKIIVIATIKDRSDRVRTNVPFEIRIPTITIDNGESVPMEDTSPRSFEVARSVGGTARRVRVARAGARQQVARQVLGVLSPLWVAGGQRGGKRQGGEVAHAARQSINGAARQHRMSARRGARLLPQISIARAA